MKRFLFFVSAILLLAGCFTSFEEEETISEISNTIQLGEVENRLISLSESFARQLQAFGFEFGDFATAPNFLDQLSFETTRIEILKNGILLFTVFEFQLSPQNSYDETIQKLRGKVDLKNAVFGEDSFYFLQNNLTTNILPLGENILAFQFPPQSFEEIRDFISSLLILR